MTDNPLIPPPDNSPPRRRTVRSLPDLSALFEESTSPAETQTTPPIHSRRVPDFAGLDDLRASGPPVEATRAVDVGVLAEPVGDDASLRMPQELEHFLPPDLWRRLKAANPQRGVLINTLERVRSTLYQLSTFLPSHLVQEKMRRAVPGLVSGQMLRGTLLFSDVSGFTALAERLAGLGPEGAERLTSIMNTYFARMLEILAWSGGSLLKFAGDAMLVYFPDQQDDQQAGWAVRAGLRMLRAMTEYSNLTTPTETVGLKMKIGVATGSFLAASVGSVRRMEYIVLGPAVAQTMAAEGATTGVGQLIVNFETKAALRAGFVTTEHKPGFFLVKSREIETLDDFEIKAETRRARGAMPWSASPQAIVTQIEVALRQIQALTPYIAAELVERIIVHARQRRVESEYRPTTTLFCNFTGLESWLSSWGEAGTQRVTSLLNVYFNAMHDVISRYGGIVSRIDPYSKGSKMLILFGAPVAHEDDPQRAVSAALAMNAELETLNDTWRKKFARYLPVNFNGPLIEHRLGITYGNTFAGQVGASTRREYTVMGDDVNLAARLMSAADMHQILLNQHIYDAVYDYFVLTLLPPIRVKGKSKPVPIYQVEGPREDTLAKRVRTRGKLVDRQTELAEAEALLVHARKGQGSILTIQGAAGMGKSHLADELLKRAWGRGFRVFYNQCRSYNSKDPYRCWSMFLRSLAGITFADYDPNTHLAKLNRMMTELNLPDYAAASLATLIGLRLTPAPRLPADESVASESTLAFFDKLRQGKTRRKGSSLDLWQQLDDQPSSDTGQVWQPLPAQLTPEERTDMVETIWIVLNSLVSKTPMVLFFEDAQWMDSASREVITTLEDRIKQAPLLMLSAQRFEAGAVKPTGQLITLEPLDIQGTTALVAHLLVSELAQIIYDQSNGTPLLVEEITRWFQRTRHINADDLKNVLQTSDFLQKLILSEVECFPEEQREIIKLASVIGIEFHNGEVQALLPPSVDPVTVSNHLRGLARARLISLVEAGVDARYVFQQGLVRDIVYNSLPFEHRRELHGKLASYLSTPLTRRRAVQARITAVLDARSAANPTQDAEVVAYHYEQAGQWALAAQYLCEAANSASQQKDFSRAGNAFSKAQADLEKLTVDEIDVQTAGLRLQAWVGQGDIAFLAGDTMAALSAFEMAWVNKPDYISGDFVIGLSCKLALAMVPQRRAEEAERLLREVLEKYPERGTVDQGPEARSQILAILAWLSWRDGKTETVGWIERCQKLLAEDYHPWAAGVKILMTDLSGKWGDARVGYKALGLPTGTALASIRIGDEAIDRGDLPRALKAYRQAVEAWGGVETRVCGLALAFYQQAQIGWQTQDLDLTRSMLSEAAAALSCSSFVLQAEGHSAIQNAQKLVSSGKGGSQPIGKWPVWNWKGLDDLFKMSVLYQP